MLMTFLAWGIRTIPLGHGYCSDNKSGGTGGLVCLRGSGLDYSENGSGVAENQDGACPNPAKLQLGEVGLD